MNAKTLILSGYGLNCEKETAHCCRLAGGTEIDTIHTSKLIRGEIRLDDYQFLILIGGFLDGDDLGAGRVAANRFKYGTLGAAHLQLQEQLSDFVQSDKLIIGICNGFQLLVKLGLLPAFQEKAESTSLGTQEVSITSNANNQFEDRWVYLKADTASPCIFTQGIEQIYLPVRHGEGRIEGGGAASRQNDILQQLVEHHQVPLQYATADGVVTEAYPDNPNGSPFGIASLCNKKGNVMGLMPHPEAYHHYTSHPHWTRLTDKFEAGASEDGEGVVFFKNAYRFLK